jgi:hypothetical protein
VNAINPPSIYGIKAFWSGGTFQYNHEGTFLYCDALANIYVPETSMETYKAAEVWKDFADKIKAITE